jgi:catechol 2,3-dioxygenase-like lactoylglutathione lyase family enzyme
MPTAFIEHVNLTVTDPERSARLFRELFGWKVRWQGQGRDGGSVIHVGDEHVYLAVWGEPGEAKDGPRFEKGVPLNHVGIVVEDLDEIERRVVAAGLETFAHGDYAPGRRFYFFDWDGIEFEIVSYG